MSTYSNIKYNFTYNIIYIFKKAFKIRIWDTVSNWVFYPFLYERVEASITHCGLSVRSSPD